MGGEPQLALLGASQKFDGAIAVILVEEELVEDARVQNSDIRHGSCAWQDCAAFPQLPDHVLRAFGGLNPLNRPDRLQKFAKILLPVNLGKRIRQGIIDKRGLRTLRDAGEPPLIFCGYVN